ncbi:MAG: hypothetical protein V7K21_04670 [Nostoc sp.]|uniref:hypothetical protein n=1 Tax=Nostoc sp. TaxID=1180 RepID=UPI002FF95437
MQLAGTFLDRQHIETALSQLKAANFSMHNVSVVAQHGDSNEATLKPLEPMVQSEAQFARHRLIERIEHGALDAGSWGGIVGRTTITSYGANHSKVSCGKNQLLARLRKLS